MPNRETETPFAPMSREPCAPKKTRRGSACSPHLYCCRAPAGRAKDQAGPHSPRKPWQFKELDFYAKFPASPSHIVILNSVYA